MTKTYELPNDKMIMADVDEKNHTATVSVYALDSLIEEVNKTGHWIWCVGSHKCSNCEEYTCFSHKQLLRYCPNCGAKMIEPQESEEQKNCDTCTYSDEVDGSNCYECVKGMRNNYKAKSEGLEQIRAEVEGINPWALAFASSEYRDTRPQIVARVKSHILAIIDKYREG